MSGDRLWTVLDLLRWTTSHFESRGIDTPRLDAECLLAHSLDCDRLRLYVDFEKPVLADERSRFRELVKRRAHERVPVAQLTGTREFWSLPLRVTPDVLVPRPETETLVAAALDALPETEGERRVLDLGTGSGAVALALAQERPKLRVTASDVSGEALSVARENAERLGLTERIRFVQGDGFEPLAGEEFDLVVSNPPYVAERDAASLPPELDHEPRLALFAGSDGTLMLRRIAAEAAAFLTEDGVLAVELAPEQAEAMCAWCRDGGFAAASPRRDLAGRERVVVARRRAGAGDSSGR